MLVQNLIYERNSELVNFTVGNATLQLKLPLPFEIHCIKQFYLTFQNNGCFQLSPGMGFPLLCTIGEHLERKREIHPIRLHSQKDLAYLYHPTNIHNATSNSMLQIASLK